MASYLRTGMSGGRRSIWSERDVATGAAVVAGLGTLLVGAIAVIGLGYVAYRLASPAEDAPVATARRVDRRGTL